jgi:NAD(P)-dependent dehydrogenase (short-subunit alcohol dehydrogenase family)
MSKSNLFKEKIVVITGGTRGIGFATAKEFARSGATVVICSRNIGSVKKAIKELKPISSSNVFGMPLDITKIEEVEIFFEDLYKKFGGIDILINNAGIQDPKPSLEITEKVWDRIINTNLKGTFFCSKFAAKYMSKKASGSIINIGSVQSIYVADGQVPYSATKAAIVQITRCLAKEWAQAGIRVNCVAPGSIPTDINKDFYSNPKNLENTLKRIPFGRQGKPEEIAKVILFLASEDSSYVTGQTIYVDGGWLLV